RGRTPAGLVTFWDGTVFLGTVALRHGTARLRTGSLRLGPNGIRADYTPGPGFDPCAAAIVEYVYAYQLRR
ncbi:MAG TPA: hypothetical protein VFF52_22120, partial [Isosphaeraceae bacterium]|nr:hypothetical protein [Isosphaeraceae bacterium]